MPELPEVELVTRSLNETVCDKKIVSARLFREKLAPNLSPKLFSKIIKNTTIRSVHRRGKHILLKFDNKKTLIVHLRMTGRFLLLPSEREDMKFTHAAFYFEDESRLIFQDQRHFGYMNLVETSKLNEAKEIKKLAPEPFSDEFSTAYFNSILNTSKRNVKEFLLDQTKVCGLGNIYAVEALFLSRINPLTPAKEISTVKINRLHKFIRKVLQDSIDHGSTMNVDLSSLEESYYGGGYEGHWRVYDQEGEACPNCKTKIKRIKQGGRSSYFCPRCQRK